MRADKAIEAFLGACQGRRLRPDTIAWYGTLLHPFAGKNPKLPKDPASIEVFLGEVAGSDEMVHGYFRALRAFYNWAEEHLGVKNPMAKIAAPHRRKKKPRTLSVAELGFLLAAPLSRRDRALVDLLADTGIRVGEAISLDVIDIGEETIMVDGKTGLREVPISGETIRELLGLAEEGFIFRGSRGRLTRSGAYQAVRRAMKMAGISGGKLGPHTLRHTFGRQYIMAGGDLVSLQRILGHSDIGTTRIYADLDLRDIIEQHQRFTPLKLGVLALQGRFSGFSIN